MWRSVDPEFVKYTKHDTNPSLRAGYCAKFGSSRPNSVDVVHSSSGHCKSLLCASDEAIVVWHKLLRPAVKQVAGA